MPDPTLSRLSNQGLKPHCGGPGRKVETAWPELLAGVKAELERQERELQEVKRWAAENQNL